MTDESMEEAKAQLRIRAHAQRATLLQDDRAEASRAAAEHFFSGIVLDPGAIVAAYWPIRDEVDCQPILIRLMDSLQPVCLPVVLGDGEPLQLRLWEQGTPLYPAGLKDPDAPRIEPKK